MLHDCIEDYVGNIIVMSREDSQHIDDLRRVFLRCRCYNLRMNSLKFAFAVSSGKVWGLVWGFIVYRKGIDLGSANGKAIQDMEPPKTIKQLKASWGGSLMFEDYV